MQELVIAIGSVAGACTGVALDKIPKRKSEKFKTKINPVLKNQIQSLEIEKDILAKTISRLYQNEGELSKIQKDKLLLRYQSQLGLVIAKIEKLQNASTHPDMEALGEGLVSLMDQKFSQLDKRLHEISSKITLSTDSSPQLKPSEPLKERFVDRIVPKKQEEKIEPKREIISFPKNEIEVPVSQKRRSVELITLTEIPNKLPEFPLDLLEGKPVIQRQIKDEIVIENNLKTEKSNTIEIPQNIEITKKEIDHSRIERKIQVPEIVRIPEAIKIPDEEKFEDDDKDINKIKNDIMKALSKLEQVEVE